MGLIRSILEGSGLRAQSQPSPLDDFWYRPAGSLGPSSAGVAVTQDTALRISTVWACATLISEAIGSLPLITYRRTADGGKERATNHPLYELLHDTPNGGRQTAPEFVALLQMWALLRGNGYARIRSGPRGPVDSLEVLSPDWCWPDLATDGTLRYRVHDPLTGRQEIVNSDDILHLKGPSLDGIWGLSVIAHARTSLGLTIAAEEYGARFFGQGARPGGILTTDQQLKEATVKRIGEQWQELFGGVGNSHKTAVLEQGITYQPVAMTMEDAQFLATREFEVSDIARWFRVPEPLIGITSKGTVWGTGIESMGNHFLTYCLLPWLNRWESIIRAKLILAPQTYFAEFLVDGLLRADTATRYAAYAVGRNWGWLSVNEVRAHENMNPIDGGDDYLQPLNMQPLGAPPPPPSGSGQTDSMPSGMPPDMQGAALVRPFIRDAAARVVRREIGAVGKLRRQAEGDPGAWDVALATFYSEHMDFVAEAMHLEPVVAYHWGLDQRAALMADPSLIESADWERERTDALAALALEGGS